MAERDDHVYLLIGDEGLREEARSRIVDALRKKHGPVDFVKYYGDDFKPDEFNQQFKTFPFLFSFQVILLERIEALNRQHQDMLAELISNIPKSTALICEGQKLDKRSALFRSFQKYAAIEELIMNESDDAERVMAKVLNRLGRRIRREAAQMLLERLGPSTLLLEQAVHQLSAFVGERKEITSDDVQLFIEREAPYGPFELTDALAERDAEKAMRVFRFLLAHVDQDVTELVGLVAWQIRRLWDVRMLLASGVSEYDLSRTLGIPPFAAKKVREAAARFSPQMLQEAADELFQLDWQIKTGQIEGVSGFETFLLRRTGSGLIQR